jgi:DNA-binding FrmR family transcriptional regulator
MNKMKEKIKTSPQVCCVDNIHRGEKLNENLIKRLNRIEGQIRGVKGMVEKEVYCDDILNQVRAIRSALDSVSKLILENHIRICLSEKMKSGDESSVEELIDTVGRILK